MAPSFWASSFCRRLCKSYPPSRANVMVVCKVFMRSGRYVHALQFCCRTLDGSFIFSPCLAREMRDNFVSMARNDEDSILGHKDRCQHWLSVYAARRLDHAPVPDEDPDRASQLQVALLPPLALTTAPLSASPPLTAYQFTFGYLM